MQPDREHGGSDAPGARGAAMLGSGPTIGGAPQAAERGAHPFGPGDRAKDGTGPPAVGSGKKHLNPGYCNDHFWNRWVEIDSGADARPVRERKGLSATHVAGHLVDPRFLGLVPPSELILEVGGLVCR